MSQNIGASLLTHFHIFFLAFIYLFLMRSKKTHLWDFSTVKMYLELKIVKVFENSDLR